MIKLRNITIIALLVLLAAGCSKVQLKSEVPSYPAAADEVLQK